jgi:hypothetical protein
MRKRNKMDLLESPVIVGLLGLEMGMDELLAEHVQVAALLPL